MSVLPKHQGYGYGYGYRSFRISFILVIVVVLLLTSGRDMVQLSRHEPQPQLLAQPKQEQPLDLQEQQQRHSQQAGGRRSDNHTTIHLESISIMHKNSSNLSAAVDDDSENDNEKKGTKEEEDVNKEPDSTADSCEWIGQQIAAANGSRLELNRIRRLAFVWSRQQQFNNNKNNQKSQEFWVHQQPAQEQQRSSYYYSTMDCFERYFDVFQNAFLSVFQQTQNRHHDQKQEQKQEEQLQTQLRRTTQQKHASDRYHYHRHPWHTMLHIPKTGGTSLCTLIKEQTNLTVAQDGNNCWSMTYAPAWCCASEHTLRMHAQSLSCLKQRRDHDNNKNKNTRPIELLMNENWLDEYCPNDQIYSILLREPVARAMSNWHHLLRFPLAAQSGGPPQWREALVKSNYMTWSLSVHRFGSSTIRKGPTTTTRAATSTRKPNEKKKKKNQTQHAQNQHRQQQTLPLSPSLRPYWFRPSNATHLEEARHRLSQMDLLLDLKYMNSSCIQWVLQFMGISQQHAMMTTTMTQNTTTSRGDDRPSLQLRNVNAAKHSGYTSLYNASEFVQGNELDRLLYQSAQQWMDADCVFFQRLLSRRRDG